VGAQQNEEGQGDETPGRWFLSVGERGNPATRIDRRRGDGLAWTEGNFVEALVHGATYFRALHQALSAVGRGDVVCFTDWRGDADERLDGPGTELGAVLAGLARKGVLVRGLVWRSHPDQEKFSEQENLHLGKLVNEAGGQILLDERVRRMGCHHQKLVLIRRPGHEDDDVAFVGGIDLCHGRGDTEDHRGDPQALDIGEQYGRTPGWHDVQLTVRGPALGDLAETFRERWEDPTPLERRSQGARRARSADEPHRPEPLPELPQDFRSAGSAAVQILRTYPQKRPPFPFAPSGERSVARSYAKVLRRARALIYIEDQYLWSEEVADLFAAALRRAPDLRLIAVVPRFPDRDGPVSGPPNRIGQELAMERVRQAGHDRVGVYDLENEEGRPIYVHAKVCVVDDTWAAVGSDNLNRRSWTHDSELSCAVIDGRRDERAPADPGGLGDGARVFARDLRLRLWREHLGPSTAEDEMLDARGGFEAWRRTAAALESWHEGGRRGPRPEGRVRPHRPAPVRWASWWAWPAYRFLIDPDGRPAELKRSGRF